ncbi:CD48 antigen-like isoform X5 [Mobula birostris]|uniref:CD48 antigen-like isoform X5 n=1 Tax=Mobula birostris TaxID=1983395 RepID=UPI003B27EAAE
MLFCSHFISLVLLASLGAPEKWKVVNGTIGSSFFLDPEHEGDLSRSEILWTFTGSNKSLVTILDHVPDKPVEKPYEQFRSRLQFNASTGCLLVYRIKPEDQGVYNFVVDERRTTTIELLLFYKLSKIFIRSYSVAGNTIQLTCEVDGNPHKYEWLKNGGEISQRHWLINESRSLILTDFANVCRTYTCVASNPISLVQANYTVNPPGAVFIPVVALCTVSALLLAIITPIDILKFGCSFNGKFQGKKGSQPFIALSGFIIIPISITVLKEEIQQNNQSCHTTILTWSIPIALLVSCVIIMSVFFATYRCKYPCWAFDVFCKRAPSCFFVFLAFFGKYAYML